MGGVGGGWGGLGGVGGGWGGLGGVGGGWGGLGGVGGGWGGLGGVGGGWGGLGGVGGGLASRQEFGGRKPPLHSSQLSRLKNKKPAASQIFGSSSSPGGQLFFVGSWRFRKLFLLN